MHRSRIMGLIALTAGCMAFAVPARAGTGDAPLKTHQNLEVPHLVEAFQMMLITQNQCINYAYDKNGNRTSQSNTAFSSTHPVWGTSSYLCFAWSAN